MKGKLPIKVTSVIEQNYIYIQRNYKISTKIYSLLHVSYISSPSFITLTATDSTARTNPQLPLYIYRPIYIKFTLEQATKAQGGVEV
jgi:hypothetical protein